MGDIPVTAKASGPSEQSFKNCRRFALERPPSEGSPPRRGRQTRRLMRPHQCHPKGRRAPLPGTEGLVPALLAFSLSLFDPSRQPLTQLAEEPPVKWDLSPEH